MPPIPTFREALQHATTQLSAREDLRDSARQDAQQLVEFATGLTRVQQLAAPERTLSVEQTEALDALIARRLRAEPIQHLRGSQEFYGRTFRVSPDVLIPRPETEDIVTAVLEATPDRDTPLRIADVGTGSGALAITLALELPQAHVTALDISTAALAVAQQNASDLGASSRIRFLESDLLAALDPAERFDVIVSNPPYIPLTDAPTLHPQVHDFEPHLALFGGPDGHDLYRRLIPEAHAHLRPDGLLLLETAGRVDQIQQMLTHWTATHNRPDLQGIARIVSSRRN